MTFEYRASKKQKYEARDLRLFEAKTREYGDEILLIWPYIPANPKTKGEIGYCLILETENVRWESGLTRKFLDLFNIRRIKEENFLEDLAVDLAQYWRKRGYQAFPQRHQLLDRDPRHVMDDNEDVQVLFDLAALRKEKA